MISAKSNVYKFKILGEIVPIFSFNSENAKLKKLRMMPRFTRGNIQVLNWDLDFLDGPALWSCIDVLVHKKWNDFIADNESPVILDCGSNIGISILNYKRQLPNAKITAFEPDPSIVAVLKRNLEKNGADDVVVIDSAVWTEKGEMSFYCEGADGSRLVPGGNESTKRTTVTTVDIADYITGPIDLIKMDIEGAEFEVIPHLGNKLKLVKAMVIECHIANDKIEKLANLLMALAAAGFKVGVNSYGPWRDLLHVRNKPADEFEFDQYMVVAAWR